MKHFLSGLSIFVIALSASSTAGADNLLSLLKDRGVIYKGAADDPVYSDLTDISYSNGAVLFFPERGTSVKFNAFLQERYSFTDFGGSSGQDNTSSFSTENARIIISGSTLHDEFSYKLESDMTGDENGGQRAPQLKDAFLSWSPCECNAFTLGQFKTQLSREFVVDDDKLQFIDRSVASQFFSLDRQGGASAAYSSTEKEFRVAAAVFNGDLTDERLNQSGNDTKHSAILSFSYDPLGKIDSRAQGDYAWLEEVGISFGAAYAYSEDDSAIDRVSGREHRVSQYILARFHGAAIEGEIFEMISEEESEASSKPFGFSLNAGYFILPRSLEIAGRYAQIDDDQSSELLEQIGAGLNYYLWRDRIKVQLGYDRFVGAGTDFVAGDSKRWSLQLSAYI